MYNSGKLGDKPPVGVAQSEERTERTLDCWGFRLPERSVVSIFSFYFFRTDDVSDVFYFIAEEGTLFHIYSDAKFGERCAYFVNVTYTFLGVVQVNDDVLYIEEAGLPFEFWLGLCPLHVAM